MIKVIATQLVANSKDVDKLAEAINLIRKILATDVAGELCKK